MARCQWYSRLACPPLRPDSVAAMRAVAMLVAVWLATLIPVRTDRQCMGAISPSPAMPTWPKLIRVCRARRRRCHPRGQQVPFDVKFSDYESHVMMYNVLDAGLAG